MLVNVKSGHIHMSDSMYYIHNYRYVPTSCHVDLNLYFTLGGGGGGQLGGGGGWELFILIFNEFNFSHTLVEESPSFSHTRNTRTIGLNM